MRSFKKKWIAMSRIIVPYIRRTPIGFETQSKSVTVKTYIMH
jgi:hypothetical protein